MKSKDFLYSFDSYLFDLDNTIYDENVYLFEAYNRIAQEICDLTFKNPEKVAEEFKYIFIKEGRKNIFNKIIKKYKLSENLIPKFLSILRTCQLSRKIEIFPYIKLLLDQLNADSKRIFIVTNGNPDQQQNKINQIDWCGLDKKIIFILANTIEKKPSIKLYNVLKETYDLQKHSTIFIGDSEVDKEFAHNAQIRFIHVSEL